MPSPPSRRRFLRGAGIAAATGLAGCSRGGEPSGATTITPAPVPSDRPTTGTGGPASGPTSADLAFDVTLQSGFTLASPARLEIAVRNLGDTRLTALGGPSYTLPFVDDDYAGVDRSGHPTLFLAPDDSELTIAPAGDVAGPLGEFLPSPPVEGCWSLPFDWPAAWGPQTATRTKDSLEPGETRRHGYGLYYIDECIAGTFAFGSTFDLTTGEPPLDGPAARARLGFILTVTGELEVLVGVQEPVVVPPSRPDG